MKPKSEQVARPSKQQEHKGLPSSPEAIRQAMLDKLVYEQGKIQEIATIHDHYRALALAVRDRLQERWIQSARAYLAPEVKIAAYLSAEYLPGPHLGLNLLNLGITEAAREAVGSLGLDLEALLDQEEEPGLGNGGLGRLAACYMESMATLERPAIGYGIRYEFGIFDQEIRDGWQVEVTDKWLQAGNPWEIAKPEIKFPVRLGGFTESYHDAEGNYRVRWVPHNLLVGTPFDTPVLGYRVPTCNTLRLWKAEACESFDFDAFNTGDYYQAVEDKVRSETITKVLYPNDEPAGGKRLRLMQQYFFVTCSLQDMLRIHKLMGLPIEQFPDRFAIQLNDTHPAIAVAELMRLLLDEHFLDWDTAWGITRRALSYTNHTLLPEALETWSLSLFESLLPRHLEIIYEINHRFLQRVREKFPGDEGKAARMSIIDEHGGKRVRMANLASVGSHAINGVAALHTELLKASVLRDFHDLWPEKILNITNGVTPRRFLLLINPGLSRLITDHVPADWPTHLEALRQLEPLAEDPSFRNRWRQVKRENKERLAQRIRRDTGVDLAPDWMFDVLIKRIHEYKRQHLQVLHIIHRYLRLKEDPSLDLPPRAFLFAGKAAPGYFMAKRIIKLITSVGEVINKDPEVNQKMKVIFVPDYNVKVAQPIYSAADLSEQISLAGKEASGTGNMKFALNGALTIGTLDGANVEIREAVGPEHFFLFGMTLDEVQARRQSGYNPYDVLEESPALRRILDLLAQGHFSGGDRELFRPVVEGLTYHDPYFLLADFTSFIDSQAAVDRAWKDRESWTRKSILNTARMGRFSSDRSIRAYCDRIWHVDPCPIRLEKH